MAGILGLGSSGTGAGTGGGQNQNMMSALMYTGYAVEGLGQVGGSIAGARQEKWAANTYLAMARAEEERGRIIAAQAQGETRAAYAKAGVGGVTVDLILEQNAKRGALDALRAGYSHRLQAYEAQQRARALKYQMLQSISQTIIGAAGAYNSLFPTGTGTSQGFGQTLMKNWGGTSPQVNPLGSADYSGYA